MIERTVPYLGKLVLDRDAIVRAALRAYVECYFAELPNRLGLPSVALGNWIGDLRLGAFFNDNGCGDYEVVAWNAFGVVGLACDLGCGPIEQLGLEIDAVTGGPDDVHGAVPDLPPELESAFLLAVSMLEVGADHGEKQAGAGFWLCGDQVGGTLFLFEELSEAWGVDRLAAWGMLRGDRLPHVCGAGEIRFYPDEPEVAPIHAIIDAVTARALVGPTELTPDELATLCPKLPDPERLLHAQRKLQKAGITWPGSPEIPPE